MSYTKLFNSIINSTIWTENDKTRIMWITMLALADKNGEIQASIPGLARAASVSIPDCESAITKFLAPDPYSRSPEDEGRRIEKIEGGWALLNHSKYRALASKDDSKSANLKRQQRFRERKERNSLNALVTPCNAPQGHSRSRSKSKRRRRYFVRNRTQGRLPATRGITLENLSRNKPKPFIQEKGC